MNLAAFFPIFSKREYPWIGEGQVGLVLAYETFILHSFSMF